MVDDTSLALRPERIAAGYFLAQAIVGIGLWVAVATSGSVHDWIDLLPSHPPVTDAFFVADLVVGVVGSTLSAIALWRRSPWALPVVAFTTGGIVYPTLYLVAYVAWAGEGRNVLSIMVPPSTLSCWFTYQTYRAGRRVS